MASPSGVADPVRLALLLGAALVASAAPARGATADDLARAPVPAREFFTVDGRFDPEAWQAAGHGGPFSLPPGVKIYPGALTPPRPAPAPLDAPRTSPDDVNWFAGFGRSVVPDASVRAAVPWSGGVAIGGDFARVSGTVVSCVAHVANDGTVTPFGPGLDGRVLALVEHQGNLWAGGEFLRSGTAFVGSIARWDGGSWRPAGAGMNGHVLALASHGNLLVAGGEFTQAGTIAASHVAAWNGFVWSPVGAGTDDWVRTLVSFDGQLWAGGDFTRAGGSSAPHVARWDGAAWQPAGDGFDGPVFTLVPHGAALHAGGLFMFSGAGFAPRVARWDGAAWHGVGHGFDNFVWTLRTHGSELWAGGGFQQTFDGIATARIARWAGGAWSAARGGMDAPVWALVAGPGGVVAGGSFARVDGDSLARLARWNGGDWNGFTPGAPDWYVRTAFPHDGGLIVAGDFDRVGPFAASGVVRWNGVGWEPVGPGIPSSAKVFALIEYGGTLWAGGDEEAAGRLWRWDGSAWQLHSSFTQATQPGVPTVKDLAVYDGELWAAGRFRRVNDVWANSIARFDGVYWRPPPVQPSLPYRGAVLALALFGGGLVAGGDFVSMGGVPAVRIARWDGAQWHPLGTGLDGRVRDLAVWNGRLAAGGKFLTAGGAPAVRVAVWDGATWSPCGRGLSATVRSLTVLGSDLVAGGDFVTVGMDSAALHAVDVLNHVARWDGERWTALGSGVEGQVFGVAATGSELWVGGQFLRAGAKRSPYVALWRDPAPGPDRRPGPPALAATLPVAAALRVAPSPFTDHTTFRFTLERPSRVTLSLFDVGGRRVHRVHDGALGAGPAALAWDGRGTDGIPVPAGVYFYRLESADGVRSGKVVRCRP